MIFVTVGTHEQPFDRLVRAVDGFKRDGYIQEDVFIQTGFSTYEPKFCTWSKMLSFENMRGYMADAGIVITHGGPSSFMMAFQVGKIPIVVPRQRKFGEHVNDHQVEFVKFIAERIEIIPVFEMSDLEKALTNYDAPVHSPGGQCYSNNTRFNAEMEKLIAELL